MTNGKFHGDTFTPKSALELKAELKAEQSPQTPLKTETGTFGAENQSQSQKLSANEDQSAEHLAELRSWLREHECERDEAQHVLSRFRYFNPAKGPLRAFAARVLDDYRLAAIEKAPATFTPRTLKPRDLDVVAKNPRASFDALVRELRLGRRFSATDIGAARAELSRALELARRGELSQGEDDPKPPGGGGGGEPVKTTPGDKPLSPAEAREILGSDQRPKWTCSGCGRRWYYDRDACPALDCPTRGQMQQAC